MLWCQGAQNIGLSNSNHKLSPRQSALSDHNATPVPDRQTDGQTDEHHDKSATICSMTASRVKKHGNRIAQAVFSTAKQLSRTKTKKV